MTYTASPQESCLRKLQLTHEGDVKITLEERQWHLLYLKALEDLAEMRLKDYRLIYEEMERMKKEMVK